MDYGLFCKVGNIYCKLWIEASNQQSINPQDILNFIPDERFQYNLQKRRADYEVKIPTGRLMFTLLVLSILRFDILTLASFL